MSIEPSKLEASEHAAESVSRDWSPEEERRARLKIDLSVLPLLCFGMIMFQLDRMNLASALTGGFTTDIGITQDTVNLGNQLMFMGIIVLEIPSNMLLQKIGPSKWIPAQVFVFGLIATLQVLLRNRGGFLATRTLLGFAEAGYIPGSIYTLSTWYTPQELGKRIAILFFGMFGGNAISPLLGAGILRLHGRAGMAGWKYIFLIEGIATMIASGLLLLVLPTSPQRPRPLFLNGLIRFSEREQYILTARQGLENRPTADNKARSGIPLAVVRKTVLNYRRWPHFISTACVFATWSPLTTYTPSIIMSLGFTRVQANALSAIGASLTLPIVFSVAWISDRTKRRGLTVICAICTYLTVLIVARCVLPHVGRWSRFGLWTVVNAFAVCYHPIHNVWVQLNCADQAERSIAISMCKLMLEGYSTVTEQLLTKFTGAMSAISGLLAGTQIFRADDSPTYHTGLIIMIALVSSGLLLAVTQHLIYLFLNSRQRRVGGKALYNP
ncbi:major facilitator superfamily domain-containing protein [Aspergillus keveii]|uniref:Major facilitator superfamily domain-containing protein n=1 Tax=Aspergillus keveii TaxID=714993 RepID=A0ABR4FPX7_9EURO